MTIDQTTSAPIDLSLQGNELLINYEAETEHAIYDICSVEGRILITGKILESPSFSIDMEGYPEGHYNIYILDGSEVYKSSFLLNSELSPQKIG